MPPRPPAEKELFDAWFDQLLLQHHVDVQRLWKRTPQFPLPFIGTQPLAVDAFGTTTTCEPETLRPDGDAVNRIIAGDNPPAFDPAFEDEGGSTSDLYQSVDEETPSDSDYIVTVDSSGDTGDFVSYSVILSLEDGSDHNSDVTVTLRWRYKTSTGIAENVNAGDVGFYVRLFQVGEGNIAEIEYKTPISSGGYIADEYELTPSEVAQITDYSALRVSVQTFHTPGELIEFSFFELEIECP